ncbi:MAG: hypothetical protein ABIW94_08400 [Gemmatimonadaceae bacterium]
MKISPAPFDGRCGWELLYSVRFRARAKRYGIDPDGVGYLNLSDSWVSGDWLAGIILYWSQPFTLPP